MNIRTMINSLARQAQGRVQRLEDKARNRDRCGVAVLGDDGSLTTIDGKGNVVPVPAEMTCLTILGGVDLRVACGFEGSDEEVSPDGGR
jgi:hypothetical protein